jgi:hypothetical protein
LKGDGKWVEFEHRERAGGRVACLPAFTGVSQLCLGSNPSAAHTPALALYSRQSDCRGRIFRFCAEKEALFLSFQLIINYLAPNDCR